MDKETRVIEKQDGLFILNNPLAPKFKTFVGSFGWAYPGSTGDNVGHFFLLGGVKSDDTIQVIHEAVGGLFEVIREAIDFKDKFWIEKMWADTSDMDILPQVYQIDGLVKYETLGKDYFGRTIWANPESKWPYFRNREAIVSLCGVPRTIVSSPMGGLDRVTILASKMKLSVHSSCPTTQWILDQSNVGDIISHPCTKALNYLIYGLTLEDTETGSELTQTNPYPNRRGK